MKEIYFVFILNAKVTALENPAKNNCMSNCTRAGICAAKEVILSRR
jgi:hypothetical protein